MTEQKTPKALPVKTDLVIGALLTAAVILLRAFILMRFWGWFLSPVTGTPSPSHLHCVGLILLSMLLIRTCPANEGEPDGLNTYRAVVSIISLSCLLLIGNAIYRIM